MIRLEYSLELLFQLPAIQWISTGNFISIQGPSSQTNLLYQSVPSMTRINAKKPCKITTYSLMLTKSRSPESSSRRPGNSSSRNLTNRNEIHNVFHSVCRVIPRAVPSSHFAIVIYKKLLLDSNQEQKIIVLMCAILSTTLLLSCQEHISYVPRSSTQPHTLHMPETCPET